MNRREFLGVVAAGLAVPAERARQAKPRPLKNWAWMRGEVKNVDEWRRTLAGLKASGFDAILIGGGSDFYRKHAPLVRQEGLELHAWMFTMMRGENVEPHPEWYAVSRSGVSTAKKPPYVDYYKFMCPSRDEVRSYLRGVVREIASVDGLTSVHLDYIRYPDVILPVALWPKYDLVQDREYPDFDFCYCEVCRERFRRKSGLDPKSLDDAPADDAWRQYRYDTITEVVGMLAGEARAAGKQITAAVFPTPRIARTLVRQDWTTWDVDALLPMVYHGFYKEGVAWIEKATREGVDALAGSRVRLYAGLYVPDLPPRELASAAQRAIDGGAHGVSAFQGDMLTPAHRSAIAGVFSKHRSRG
jgi:uncharacterized lipoprotein YddW (UPF0748 family)